MKHEYLTYDFRSIPLYADVSPEDWNDWKWQIRNAIRDIPTLEKVLELSEDDKSALDRTLQKFRMAITPYYASLMDRENPNCPVRLQGVPTFHELEDEEGDLLDPLYEDKDSPVPGLTHRYPDRVLLLVTNICSMYCRHCTRRRMVGFDDSDLSTDNIEAAVDYIKNHPEVRDVLISGGDPLILSDDRLEWILKQIREIDHVEIIRIGTRTPVVLPQRITPELVEMLSKYHPIYINTHFNHPKEITAEAKSACEMLANGGVPLGNQTVLLKRVNDHPSLMKLLMQKLLSIRVKPYYIYQCDMSRGIGHFRTSIAKGIEIIENLRGHTTGMAVPTFVVDAPGGAGKIPLMPNYLVSQSDRRLILRNYEGMITTYTQPKETVSSSYEISEICDDPNLKSDEGIARLLNGDQLFLIPENLRRKGN